MRRLVESWVEAEREYHGNTLAAAIRRMNEACGVHVTHSRVSEWRRGVYAPSQLLLSMMLHRALPWALRKAEIAVTPVQKRKLDESLWVHGEKDGGHFIELL